MKFIHTADLHLGCNYSSSLPENVIKVLKENQRLMFKKLINTANEKNIEFLLIAGDLFDSNNVEKNLTEFVITEFERCNAKVLLCCGNHDPYTISSIYEKNKFPENVYIFKENIDKIEFEEADIYGFSFIAPHKNTNTLKGFKVDNPDKLNIMVAHGEIKTESFYNPIDFFDIEQSLLDYIALGHIHNENEIKKRNKTYYGYSGTPQANSFKETIETKILIGTLYKDSIQIEKEDISIHKFSDLKIDISDVLTNEEAISRIMLTLNSLDLKNSLINMELIGNISDEAVINCMELEKQLSEICLYIKALPNYNIKYNLNLLKDEQSIRGEFVRNALKHLSDEDEMFINKVIEYGVKFL